MTKQNKKNLPLFMQEDKQEEFEQDLLDMLASQGKVEESFASLTSLALRMVDHWGFTKISCISPWTTAGEGYAKKGVKIGIDTASPNEWYRVYSIGVKFCIANLKKFSPKNARKILNSYLKFEKERLAFLETNPGEFKKADTHAKNLLSNKVNNIECSSKLFSEQSIIAHFKNTIVHSKISKIKGVLSAQETLLKNGGKKKASVKRTFAQKVNAKFDELITMLQKADGNVFKKDFDLQEYLEKLEKPKLK